MTRRRWIRGAALETVLALKAIRPGDMVELDLSRDRWGNAGAWSSCIEGEDPAKVKRKLYPCSDCIYEDRVINWNPPQYSGPCMGIVHLDRRDDERHIIKQLIVGWMPALRKPT